MPNVNDLFPSKYLKASDLKGREPVVTIAKVEYEAVGQSREMKAVVYFKNVNKGLVLNKTNCARIVQIVGSGVTEDWPGHALKLYATTTTFQGEEVECIRIRQNANKPGAAASAGRQAAVPPAVLDSDFGDAPVGPALTDDDIPF